MDLTTEDTPTHSLDYETEIDANECVQFHQGSFLHWYLSALVTVIELENGTKRLVQLCPDFKPGMTHQIFENEKIIGVKDPHVDIYFNPSTGDVPSMRVFNCRCVYM